MPCILCQRRHLTCVVDGGCDLLSTERGDAKTQDAVGSFCREIDDVAIHRQFPHQFIVKLLGSFHL